LVRTWQGLLKKKDVIFAYQTVKQENEHKQPTYIAVAERASISQYYARKTMIKYLETGKVEDLAVAAANFGREKKTIDSD
jgi:hypothetical protein